MSLDCEETGYPARQPFSGAQLVQARYIGRVTDEHRSERPSVITHAIDNVTPDVIADRDDGIYVKIEPDTSKGYRVHVTVADVAAHVRFGSRLSQAAWQRAFTVYMPGSTDPMFPKILEENLSLEHGKERLGLTVNITLDKDFKPVHTSFTPVVTTPDNASYGQVKERATTDPQFRLMGTIAEGIRDRYLNANHAAWDELLEDRRLRSGGNDTDAMKMVATYMLLTNNCVAEFFNACGLPFLYRNFDPESYHSARAFYYPEALRHSGVESMGLKGAYCHFTSPIRRGADYFNGVMVHYVVNVISRIEKQMEKEYPDIDQGRLQHELWHKGPEIMRLVSAMEDHSMSARIEMNRLLNTIAINASNGRHGKLRSYKTIINHIELPPLPISREQLERFADRMNALAGSPEMAEIHKTNEKYYECMERIGSLAEAGETDLSTMSASKFGSLIYAASVTGEMPQNLFTETMARLRNHTLDRTIDLFNIFLRAQFPASDRWRALKGEIAKQLKNRPDTVRALFNTLGYSMPGTIQALHLHVPENEEVPEVSELLLTRGEPYTRSAITAGVFGKISQMEEASFRRRDITTSDVLSSDAYSIRLPLNASVAWPLNADTALGAHTVDTLSISGGGASWHQSDTLSQTVDVMPSHTHYALIVMTRKDGKRLSTPFYSVGHNTRAAMSHALYSFLEHYAFSQLMPLSLPQKDKDAQQEPAFPHLLYADLDLPNAQKLDIIKTIVHESGAQIDIHTEPSPGGFRTAITVSGGNITVPIITEAEEATEETAIRTALRRMLRNGAFKTLSHSEDNALLLNPQTVLKREVEERGGSVEFVVEPVDARFSNSGFCALVSVRMNGEENIFEEVAPNKDRALRVAAAKALEALGTVDFSPKSRAASWTSKESRSSPGMEHGDFRPAV